MTIAGRKSVTGVIPDFGAAIDAIRSSGADTVFFGGIASEFSQLVLQARAAGLRTTRFVSGEPSASSAYLDSTGTAANGTFVSSFSNMSDEIVAKYRSDVGSATVSVPAFAAEGYDVASLIGAGISDAIANGARSPMEIRAGIRTFLDGLTPTHPFHGEAKDISFQPDHELQGPPRSLLFFYRVNDGHLHLLADADRLLD